MIAPRKIKFEAKKKRNARIVDNAEMRLDEAEKWQKLRKKD